MSRGRQLEVAVDSLSSWYFEYDEPKTGWRTEVIHPLPEEQSVAEPQEDTDRFDFTAMTPTTYTIKSQRKKPLEPSIDEDKPSRNQVDLDDRDLSPERSFPPLSRDRASRRSSASTRATTVGSPSASYNDLVVTGYTLRGTEKKVMYHIDVRGNESQLQTYTIRRSYTDFKHLHAALGDILEARKEHYIRVKALAARRDQEKLMLSLKERSSFDASTISTACSSIDHRGSQDAEALAAATEELKEAWVDAFTLPPLPHAGFLSFWRRHDRTHLQNRCEMFQEILRAAMQHPDLRLSYAMQHFLSVAPQSIRERGSSYVSLCEYSVPRLDPGEETRERKKMARERRRNSSALSFHTE
ncbi:hypothetical protein Poli38472_010050 [Pythium oligandrum]|uniref:PX domain-containing protein n=1 Tax=Pythium oligandrum TaxID=41045 RepID=A0A8K1C889_PYTOL|nr:hypothetical protein Poli38472_010050 [Pythium oligandrum]|eukprot:TMW58491.1 hypothetical protein Poli38472_010050 [Pythium oligandrum]